MRPKKIGAFLSCPCYGFRNQKRGECVVKLCISTGIFVSCLWLVYTVLPSLLFFYSVCISLSLGRYIRAVYSKHTNTHIFVFSVSWMDGDGTGASLGQTWQLGGSFYRRFPGIVDAVGTVGLAVVGEADGFREQP